MKRTVWIMVFSIGLSITAQAEDWSGKLIDANCNDQKEQEKTISCDARSTTTVFALNVSGKVYKLDRAGNSKAAAALKYRARSESDPSKPQATEVKATVTGTEAGGMIMVESVGLQ